MLKPVQAARLLLLFSSLVFLGLSAFAPSFAEALPESLQAKGDKPYVLLDFYAPFCGTCKMMEPYLQQLAADTASSLTIRHIDLTQPQNEPYGVAFKITGTPTYILFGPDKNSVYRMETLISPRQLRQHVLETLHIKSAFHASPLDVYTFQASEFHTALPVLTAYGYGGRAVNGGPHGTGYGRAGYGCGAIFPAVRTIETRTIYPSATSMQPAGSVFVMQAEQMRPQFVSTSTPHVQTRTIPASGMSLPSPTIPNQGLAPPEPIIH